MDKDGRTGACECAAVDDLYNESSAGCACAFGFTYKVDVEVTL